MNKIPFLCSLASKYIFRNKARSFFILSSISLSLIVSVIILSLFSGMFIQIQKAVTDTNTGNYQLQEKNFAESSDSNSPLLFSEELKSKLSPLEGHSPELVLEANLVAPEGSAALQILGIDPESNLSVIDLGLNMIDGDFFSESPHGIVIGRELAEKFKFRVGDDFLFNFQDQEGNLRSEILPITGIYDFNSREFKKIYAYIHYQTWQDFFLTESSRDQLFHRIVIKTKNDFSNPTSNLILKSWRDINPEMAVVIDFNKGLLNFFMLIIAFTVSLSIFNPIRMLLEERLPEFRMMNVIGVSRNILIPLTIIEALMMMGISLVLSITVFIGLISLLSKTGIDLTNLSNGQVIERAGIELPSIIYPIWEAKHIYLSIIFVTITIGFTYIISLRSILKKLRGAA